MWESPIYKFKAEINSKKQTIFIDVTGSAPTMKIPGKQLEGTFKRLLDGLDPKKTKILDFGAAKLRNTIYLLKKGYTIYSCEFKDLFKRSKQAQDFLTEAKKFDNFKPLIFPKEFIEFDEKFDVILLINVLNIMPIQLERLCVLALCREKLKEGGRVLWYTQHGTYSKEDAVTELLDGIVTGKGRKYYMFYRDFMRKEIHDMLQSAGFLFNKKFTFPTSGPNQAYVFNPIGPVLVDKTLGLISQLKKASKLKTIERKSYSKKETYETKIPVRISKIRDINLLKTYSEELDKIRPGKSGALKYHKLMFGILQSIFDNRLKKPRMEEPLADKTKWVDITFKNPREKGFFEDLSDAYCIVCPNIFIECKNYNNDISNPEFAQIHTDLNKIRGQFGILICRTINNWSNIKKKQEHMRKDDKYVIVLEDVDIKKLISWKVGGDEEAIDDYLEEKFKELT